MHLSREDGKEQIKDLVSACINKITKGLTPWSMMMTFLISFYYRLNEVKMESYNHIRKYLLYSLSIAPFRGDPIIEDLWNNRSHSNIVVEDKSHLLLHLTGKPSLRIHIGIFKTCYAQHMARFKKEHSQPDLRFTLSRVVREAPENPVQTSEIQGLPQEGQKPAYPHYYSMKSEEMTETYLFAKHEDVSSDFLIFQAGKGNQKAGDKYDEHYVGILEKNFWGTQFTLWDNGLPQQSFEKIPEGFGSLRKKLLGNQSIISSMTHGPCYHLVRRQIQDEHFGKQAKRPDCCSI